ncbi:MAG: patatin family protein [Eggerthellales bacterium]|nr:patatin family protein [Eggerthellales bacterium]
MIMRKTPRPQDPGVLESNITDVALVFEGGGMRCAHTAGVLVRLLEEGLFFDSVYGVSAGASHVVNYVSRDPERARSSFVDLVLDPEFGGIGSMLKGQGYFNSKRLYEDMIAEAEGTDGVFCFDWNTFVANPAKVHIEAYDWDTGLPRVFTKEDMTDSLDVARKVRASSSLPVFMPPTFIDGRGYMDGGLADNWGICIHEAFEDGFDRAVVVRTQPKGYRKKPVGALTRGVLKAVYHKHPLIAERSIARPAAYNALCDEVERLEQAGKVKVFYPDEMPITNSERDYETLSRVYDMGYAQSARFVKELKDWL